MCEHAARVKEIVATERVGEGSYLFTPQRELDGISMNWFKAAEKALRESNGILNVKTVKILAADAWCQHLLNTKIKSS